MCAIIDANVRDQVFGKRRPKAGEFLFNWLNSDTGSRKIVVGGKLLEELSSSENFNTWLRTALLVGRAQRIPDKEVDNATKDLQEQRKCTSNDEHVVALAKVSGARLLFTNDKDLQNDFKCRQILEGVRGKIYTTLKSEHVTSTHRRLLKNNDLCGT